MHEDTNDVVGVYLVPGSQGACHETPTDDGTVEAAAAITAFNNEVKQMKRILKHYQFDLTYKDRMGRTVLHWACASGALDTTAFLLDHGARINALDARKWTPLTLASINGRDTVVQLLLARGAYIQTTDVNKASALHWACALNREIIATLLLNSGAIVDAEDSKLSTPLHYCALMGSLGTAHLLIECGANKEHANLDGQTPFHCAVGQTSFRMLQVLHHCKVDVNRRDKDGETPLVHAVRLNNVDVVALLCEMGARVNDVVPPSMRTPLHDACMVGNAAMLRVLLRYDADANKRDAAGRVPLHYACMSDGKVRVARILLDHKPRRKHNDAPVDANAGDSNMCRPLHLAAFYGAINCVKLLLKRGVDPLSTDRAGRTCLQWAFASANTETVKLLRDLGMEGETHGQLTLPLPPPQRVTEKTYALKAQRVQIESELSSARLQSQLIYELQEWAMRAAIAEFALSTTDTEIYEIQQEGTAITPARNAQLTLLKQSQQLELDFVSQELLKRKRSTGRLLAQLAQRPCTFQVPDQQTVAQLAHENLMLTGDNEIPPTPEVPSARDAALDKLQDLLDALNAALRDCDQAILDDAVGVHSNFELAVQRESSAASSAKLLPNSALLTSSSDPSMFAGYVTEYRHEMEQIQGMLAEDFSSLTLEVSQLTTAPSAARIHEALEVARQQHRSRSEQRMREIGIAAAALQQAAWQMQSDSEPSTPSKRQSTSTRIHDPETQAAESVARLQGLHAAQVSEDELQRNKLRQLRQQLFMSRPNVDELYEAAMLGDAVDMMRDRVRQYDVLDAEYRTREMVARLRMQVSQMTVTLPDDSDDDSDSDMTVLSTSPVLSLSSGSSSPTAMNDARVALNKEDTALLRRITKRNCGEFNMKAVLPGVPSKTSVVVLLNQKLLTMYRKQQLGKSAAILSLDLDDVGVDAVEPHPTALWVYTPERQRIYCTCKQRTLFIAALDQFAGRIASIPVSEAAVNRRASSIFVKEHGLNVSQESRQPQQQQEPDMSMLKPQQQLFMRERLQAMQSQVNRATADADMLRKQLAQLQEQLAHRSVQTPPPPLPPISPEHVPIESVSPRLQHTMLNVHDNAALKAALTAGEHNESLHALLPGSTTREAIVMALSTKDANIYVKRFLRTVTAITANIAQVKVELDSTDPLAFWLHVTPHRVLCSTPKRPLLVAVITAFGGSVMDNYARHATSVSPRRSPRSPTSPTQRIRSSPRSSGSESLATAAAPPWTARSQPSSEGTLSDSDSRPTSATSRTPSRTSMQPPAMRMATGASTVSPRGNDPIANAIALAARTMQRLSPVSPPPMIAQDPISSRSVHSARLDPLGSNMVVEHSPLEMSVLGAVTRPPTEPVASPRRMRSPRHQQPHHQPLLPIPSAPADIVKPSSRSARRTLELTDESPPPPPQHRASLPATHVCAAHGELDCLQCILPGSPVRSSAALANVSPIQPPKARSVGQRTPRVVKTKSAQKH